MFNCNRDAGQTVFHIHLHLLAGRGLAGRRMSSDQRRSDEELQLTESAE